ncbi:uncharacterized protein J3D65DRAFT_131686 [Phyllosticta citribraziliensis]|uniref:Uncharacterized protein n=1 Tax=Phyllosticta citribraziliensis TaxID=989973 RepID=A0ABR1L601_9PEZI
MYVPESFSQLLVSLRCFLSQRTHYVTVTISLVPSVQHAQHPKAQRQKHNAKSTTPKAQRQKHNAKFSDGSAQPSSACHSVHDLRPPPTLLPPYLSASKPASHTQKQTDTKRGTKDKHQSPALSPCPAPPHTRNPQRPLSLFLRSPVSAHRAHACLLTCICVPSPPLRPARHALACCFEAAHAHAFGLCSSPVVAHDAVGPCCAGATGSIEGGMVSTVGLQANGGFGCVAGRKDRSCGGCTGRSVMR